MLEEGSQQVPEITNRYLPSVTTDTDWELPVTCLHWHGTPLSRHGGFTNTFSSLHAEKNPTWSSTGDKLTWSLCSKDCTVSHRVLCSKIMDAKIHWNVNNSLQLLGLSRLAQIRMRWLCWLRTSVLKWHAFDNFRPSTCLCMIDHLDAVY